MRVHIDWTACDARGGCTELLPEILARDPFGYPVPRDGTTEPTVPSHLGGHANQARKLCPHLALHLIEA